jgi:hypothetical protein
LWADLHPVPPWEWRGIRTEKIFSHLKAPGLVPLHTTALSTNA